MSDGGTNNMTFVSNSSSASPGTQFNPFSGESLPRNRLYFPGVSPQSKVFPGFGFSGTVRPFAHRRNPHHNCARERWCKVRDTTMVPFRKPTDVRHGVRDYRSAGHFRLQIEKQ